jgi:two-component system CheB/CheR fusion protein
MPKSRKKDVKKSSNTSTFQKKKDVSLKKIKKRKDDFYVVGIGGSAGSLEALEQFFLNMPVDSDLVFVIVQHLDPKHKDIMPEILQRVTKMKVFQAKDGMRVKPNCVYVIPPNKDMSLMRGELHLLAPVMTKGVRMPIDFFLRSLAEDREEKAIAIILSGMGSDGTLGLKEIKAKLGMVMVQSLDSAKFEGMPRSALETDLVDFITSPEKLPAKLLAYVSHFTYTPKEVPAVSRKTNNTLQKIFVLLRNQTGHDFSFYKKNTIYRRIERRMNVHQLSTVAKYLRYLQINPNELELLFKELLIGVTNFFRDPEAYETLRKKGFPLLFNEKSEKSQIRAWVIGCSTGEEAFSLAIILREYLEEIQKIADYKIQIFATDIDKDSIDVARIGFYPENISADVPIKYLKKYFTKEEDGYRINKVIREMIIFAAQDIITDPPFTKLDIIVCRNLLIYLNSEMQKKLFPMFHYALNTQGLLFLGNSETIGTFGYLFKTVDNKNKIFIRRELKVSDAEMIEFPLLQFSNNHKNEKTLLDTKKEKRVSISELVKDALLEIFSPPTVFINEVGDILYIHGRTGKYLEPATGKASMNLFAMAREGIRFELSNAVHKAESRKIDVTIKNLKVKTNGDYQSLDLHVKPFMKPDALKGLLMVTFMDIPFEEKRKQSREKSKPSSKQASRVAELEQELQFTKEYLQTTVEEMETSQEELKSTNEELQSTNEELQSTNEELTTSKEELQSLNEETTTVNAELQNKVEELTRANNDMKNLLDSTEIATIFLDHDLKVKRFTPAASKITHLLQSDIGRPINHLVSKFKYDSIREDVKQVLSNLIFKEIQVETFDGKWFLMRIAPYRTIENVIDGVVITFTNITTLKTLELALIEKEKLCQQLEEKQKNQVNTKK